MKSLPKLYYPIQVINLIFVHAFISVVLQEISYTQEYNRGSSTQNCTGHTYNVLWFCAQVCTEHFLISSFITNSPQLSSCPTCALANTPEGWLWLPSLIGISELPATNANAQGESMAIYNNIVIETEITCNHCSYITRGLLVSVFCGGAIQFDCFLLEERKFRFHLCLRTWRWNESIWMKLNI